MNKSPMYHWMLFLFKVGKTVGKIKKMNGDGSSGSSTCEECEELKQRSFDVGELMTCMQNEQDSKYNKNSFPKIKKKNHKNYIKKYNICI